MFTYLLKIIYIHGTIRSPQSAIYLKRTFTRSDVLFINGLRTPGIKPVTVSVASPLLLGSCKQFFILLLP